MHGECALRWYGTPTAGAVGHDEFYRSGSKIETRRKIGRSLVGARSEWGVCVGCAAGAETSAEVEHSLDLFESELGERGLQAEKRRLQIGETQVAGYAGCNNICKIHARGT